MHILLFGGTGMIGHGVLDTCLRDPSVTRVTVVGRQRTGRSDAKLREIVIPDVAALAPYSAELSDASACFFCLGVSSAGMNEADYTRVTYDLALAVARQLVQIAPGMTFCYVSGMGTDSSERGRSMWARVKGATENALFALPFARSFMFRPAVVTPEGGAKSKTTSYRVLYMVLGPLLPLFKRLFPAYLTTTGEIGRAMLAVTRDGYPRRVLESRDITAAST